MGELGYGLDLPEEPLGSHRRGQVVVQNLDGHLAFMLQISGEVGRSRTTATDGSSTRSRSARA
jgi:hypothetical protein